MILFIHGFNSSGSCEKCLLLKSMKPDAIVPSLDLLDVSTSLAVLEKTLKEIDAVDRIIGASFGGFYAHYLAKKYSKKLLLINPIVNPLDFSNHIDTEVYNLNDTVNVIKDMLRFNTDTNFTQKVEVLLGLEDSKVDCKASGDIFKRYACKYYKDNHYLLKGFKDYLKENQNL